MKWRLQQLGPTNRWYPVLLRYITYIEGMVDGLGGNSQEIPPSPYGFPPAIDFRHERREFTGKVAGLLFDRFGDFEGFRTAH